MASTVAGRTGRLIVRRDVATTMPGVLRRLFADGFPIRRMVPIDVYGGSDFRSIEADNTSAFNCGFVGGTARYSQHAYGRAIDVNPIRTRTSPAPAPHRIDTSTITVNGRSLHDNNVGRFTTDRDVIGAYDAPLMGRAGFSQPEGQPVRERDHEDIGGLGGLPRQVPREPC